MAWKVGDTVSISKTISDSDVRTFAEISGDHNPVHLDDKYAANTVFGRRIAHGILTASLISSAIANHLPGPGTLYLGQTLKFVAPAFPGDTITATITVTAVREDKPILTLQTVCKNQAGQTVIEGEATVKAAVAKVGASK